MSWAAVDRLDDAYRATRSLLVPVEVGRWLRLAVLALLVGGAGGGVGGSTGGSSGAGGGTVGWVGEELPLLSEATLLAIAIVVVLLALVVGLLVGLLAAIAEFAFVESLRTTEVTIRRYARRHWSRGLQLFALRLALGLLAVALVFVVAGLLALAALTLGPVGAIVVGVLAVPLGLLAVLGILVVDRATALFVVPTMLATDVGLLAGWRRFLPTLRSNWREFGVYALVWVGLAFAAAVLLTVLVAIPGLFVAALFGAIFLAGLLLAESVLALGLLVMAIAALGFVVCLLAVFAVAQVPVQTFVRYHALYVLGDADGELALLEAPADASAG